MRVEAEEYSRICTDDFPCYFTDYHSALADTVHIAKLNAHNMIWNSFISNLKPPCLDSIFESDDRVLAIISYIGEYTTVDSRQT